MAVLGQRSIEGASYAASQQWCSECAALELTARDGVDQRALVDSLQVEFLRQPNRANLRRLPVAANDGVVEHLEADATMNLAGSVVGDITELAPNDVGRRFDGNGPLDVDGANIGTIGENTLREPWLSPNGDAEQ